MAENEEKRRESPDREIKENPTLAGYISELKEDTVLTVGNIREKSLTVSAIRSKWLAYLFKERENLQRAQKVRRQIIEKKSASTQSSALRLKSDEKLAESDEKVKRLDQLIKMTKENIDYIEKAQNVLADFVWNIKNAVEILKMERV